MDYSTRRAARQLLAGYAHGADAPIEATARALAKAEDATGVVLVEGISDQIAVETLATRSERDLAAEGVVVVPVGGAHAMAKYLLKLGPRGKDLKLAGLCDGAEEAAVRLALDQAGIGTPRDRTEMERLGFFVCVDDLESELIRALGTDHVKTLFEANEDLGSFRSLQMQPEWRGQPIGAQMRRFLGSGSRRKLRYARIFVGALEADQVPYALSGVIRSI